MNRTCRKNSKVTNLIFDTILNTYRAYRRAEAYKTTGKLAIKGLKYLFTKDKGIDTNDARENIKKIDRLFFLYKSRSDDRNIGSVK